MHGTDTPNIAGSSSTMTSCVSDNDCLSSCTGQKYYCYTAFCTCYTSSSYYSGDPMIVPIAAVAGASTSSTQQIS